MFIKRKCKTGGEEGWKHHPLKATHPNGAHTHKKAEKKKTEESHVENAQINPELEYKLFIHRDLHAGCLVAKLGAHDGIVPLENAVSSFWCGADTF